MQWKSVGYAVTAADYDASCTNGQQNAVTGSRNIVTYSGSIKYRDILD